jgi:hypothetical protein
MELAEKLVSERRARLAAERLLELKSRELFAANRKLSDHARALSDEIVLQRRVVESAHSEAEELRGENTRVRSDLTLATEARNVAEIRLWLALETIRDGFAVYDAESRLVVANSAYLSIFDGLEEIGPGAPARDILRIGLEEGVFDPEGENPAEWAEALLARWRGETIPPRTIRLWNGHSIRLVDRRGADGGIVSLALDITETVRHEARLREARRKAEAANRAKSAFLANMSHELRTPMNGVIGMAELLAETSLSEEQQLYASTIRSSGEALLLIINDVLDYSKLEAEKLELHPGPCGLAAILDDVAQMLLPSAKAKAIELTASYDATLPRRFLADGGRIRQILTNLAGNAVKFTERGGVAIRASGEAAEGGLWRLRIEVEDTGIGIDPAMAEHIFGEFNQVEDERNRKFEGTGLGLAISRRLAALMGGRIALRSVLGQGSCFALEIELAALEAPERALECVPEPPPARRLTLRPAPQAPEAALAPQPLPAPAAPPAPAGPRRLKVLAAEDNRTNQLVFAKMLKDEAVDITFAGNGREAVEAFERLGPDIVFMDISMPEMDGKEATMRIRAREAEAGLPRLPVVALTAHALAGDEADILAAGLDRYLTKPLKKAAILGVLAEFFPEIAPPMAAAG